MDFMGAVGLWVWVTIWSILRRGIDSMRVNWEKGGAADNLHRPLKPSIPREWY